MPYSSGVYTPASPEYPAIAGTLIEASKFNTIIADIAAALSIALPRDGQAPLTGNIPAGGFKFTGAGKAAARDQFATYEQLQDGEANFVAAADVTGTANAVLLAISPAPSGYEAAIDLFYVVEIENTSEDVTHNLNSLGNKNTKKFIGGAKVKIAIGDLQVGMLVHLKYDGTDLILMNPRGYAQGTDVASAATIDLDASTGDLVDVTGVTAITAITLRRGQQRTIRFTGILTFTHGASLVLPTGANITTAAGDYAIVRGYAAGVVRVVAYSRANGQALSSVAAEFDMLDAVTATTEVVNSAVETAIYTKSVVGGTLSTNKALRLTMILDYLNNSGAAATLTLRGKFGGTTITALSFNAIAGSATRKTIKLVLDLHAKGATNSQVAGMNTSLDLNTASGGGAGAGGVSHVALFGGHNALAIDSTADKDLVVSAEHDAAHGSLSVKMLSARLELLG